MSDIKRRDFIRKASLAAAGSALALSGCNSQSESGTSTPAKSGKKFNWRMVTTWPPHFPVLGEGAENFARWVEEMSDGRLKIQVYGGDELVPALQAFDAVSQGTAEMGHGAAYYWAGKAPAAQFFGAVPFGMNAQQINSWLYAGGGLKLWEDLYDKFNLVPLPAGNTGIQMGGWFNRDINTIDDFKGLKMRIPGLGGKVVAKAGGTAVLVAGGEIYTSLERGVIDATEWVGPYHDYKMGFHKIAKNYYYPGWHEPGAVLEIFINKNAFNSLPVDLQHIVRSAAMRSNIWMLAEFDYQNQIHLKKFKEEHNIQVKKFPDEVLKKLKQYSAEVIEELVSTDPESKKVYDSYSKFAREINVWSGITEEVFYSNLIK